MTISDKTTVIGTFPGQHNGQASPITAPVTGASSNPFSRPRSPNSESSSGLPGLRTRLQQGRAGLVTNWILFSFLACSCAKTKTKRRQKSKLSFVLELLHDKRTDPSMYHSTEGLVCSSKALFRTNENVRLRVRFRFRPGTWTVGQAKFILVKCLKLHRESWAKKLVHTNFYWNPTTFNHPSEAPKVSR